MQYETKKTNITPRARCADDGFVRQHRRPKGQLRRIADEESGIGGGERLAAVRTVEFEDVRGLP